MRRLWLLGVLLWSALLLRAQDNDLPFVGMIAFDTPVSDSITARAIYDWWELPLRADDVIRVRMQAYDGLIPLIGIMDEGRELLARSDDSVSAEPDGLLEYEFRAPADGNYTIIATRQGNANGTTTGRYVLDVSLVSRVLPRENLRPEVQFRCDDHLVTGALFLSFEDKPRRNAASGVVEEYGIYAYGLGDFTPFVRVFADISEDALNCTGNGGELVGATWFLPDQPPQRVDDEARVARALLRNFDAEQTFGTVRVALGSRDGGRGRFMLAIQGLRLDPRGDIDSITLRLAPFARAEPLLVYAVADPNTRLDLVLSAVVNGVELFCDDAGRHDCADVPSFVGYGFQWNDAQRFLGRRSDAGLRLQPNNTDPITLQVAARGNAATGAYTLFFVGTLP